MRPDTIAVIVICVLALAYFLNRVRKSFRGGSSCGCGCDGCGDLPAKGSRTGAQCSGGCPSTSFAPRSSLDHRGDLR